VKELRRDYDDILMKKLAKSRRVQSDTSLPWNMAKKPELAPEETVRAQAEIAEVFKRFLKVRARSGMGRVKLRGVRVMRLVRECSAEPGSSLASPKRTSRFSLLAYPMSLLQLPWSSTPLLQRSVIRSVSLRCQESVTGCVCEVKRLRCARGRCGSQEVESKAATHVREKVGTESWLTIPPDMMMAEHAVFYHDFKNLFAKYTFYGIEFELLVRNGQLGCSSAAGSAPCRLAWCTRPL